MCNYNFIIIHTVSWKIKQIFMCKFRIIKFIIPFFSHHHGNAIMKMQTHRNTIIITIYSQVTITGLLPPSAPLRLPFHSPLINHFTRYLHIDKTLSLAQGRLRSLSLCSLYLYQVVLLNISSVCVPSKASKPAPSTLQKQNSKTRGDLAGGINKIILIHMSCVEI